MTVTYQQRDRAARAALEALHEAAQKAEEIRRDPLKAMCDQFEKENSTFVQDQQAIEAQRRAAEAAKKPEPEPMDATSRCPEPGTLPAVASGKAPGGAVIPGMAATNPLDAMRALMADPKTTQEVSDRIKIREASIAQIDAVHHLSEGEKQQLRDSYDRKAVGTQIAGGIIDIGAKIADDVTVSHAEHEASKDKYLPERGTVARAVADVAVKHFISDKLTVAVGAGSVYHHVVAPVVDPVIGAVASMVHENAKSMARRDAVIAEGAHAMGFGPKPLNTPEEAARNIDLGGAVLKEQATAALRPVVETVQSSIELATGSKRAGEVLTEPALMALTEGAFRLAKPVLTVAKTGLKTAATALRNLEVTVDSAAFLRHNTGVPFDAVKIGTKAPAATALETATGKTTVVSEAAVSGAPLNTKVFNPKNKDFYDKAGNYGGNMYYREKGTKFWYSKDAAGTRSHASSWKLYEQDGKKIVKIGELGKAGETLPKNPSDTLSVIKLKDMAMQGGGR